MRSRFLKILGAVALINIIARLLGFAREVIIGYQYGTTYQADSIITAFTIPNFIYIVIGGAITTAFISVYSKLTEAKRHAFVTTIFTGLAIGIGAITLLFLLFPTFWIELFFSGMEREALELTSTLFQWMAPATFFLAMAMALSGLHNVHENFRLTSFSTLLFNGFFLVIGVGFTFLMGELSYSVGATVGAIFMFLLLLYYVRKRKLSPIQLKLVKMPETKRFIKLAIPIMFGGATIQFYAIIQRVYAAGLDEGYISALNYASKMTQFPQAILMTSVTTIIYPMLAKAVGEGDTRKVRTAYEKGFQMLTILLIPATVFIYLYAEQIISFIFEYGNFTADSTARTYPLLQLFALSIFTLALNTYITRFFYAMENSYLPIVLNVISVFGVNIFVIVMFIEEMGAGAIALGTVIGTAVNMVLLLVFAKWKLQLSVISFGNLMKLIPFLLVAGAGIWIGSLLPISMNILELIVGGVITVGFIGIGYIIFVKK